MWGPVVAQVGHATVFSLAVLCCWTALADATPASDLVLRWDVAESCPDRAKAQRAIVDFLTQRAALAAPGAKASVVIARRPNGDFHATISLQDASGHGERHFEGSDCERVAEAAALIIAMTLESTRAAERLTVKPAAPQSAVAVNDLSEPMRLSVGARAAGDLGSMPEPSMGVVASAGVHFGVLHAEVEVTAWLPRSTQNGSSIDSAAEVGLFSAALRGCYDVLRNAGHTLGLEPCLGAEAGLSTAQGIRVVDRHRDQAFWFAALAGLTLRQLVPSGFGAWLSVDAGLPFFRTNYLIDNVGVGPVFRTAPVIARASLGVGWIF